MVTRAVLARLRLPLILVGSVGIAIGCSSSSSSSPAQSSTDAGSMRACAPLTVTQPDGSCAPADFAIACAAGFAPDPSGYGCRDVLPADTCTGATRAALGQTTCAPVGDCNGAFPPAGATLFVNPSGAVDATHFTTIGAAVAVATSGAVIAVDSGTYEESVTVTQPISIVGKCAANVIIDGQNGLGVGGIYVNGVTGVAVSGVTIRGQYLGVRLAANSGIVLKQSILDSNSGVGLALQDGSGSATIDDVVIRNTQESSEPGFGINAQSSGQLQMTNTELTGNHDTALRISTNSTATVSNSVIRNTMPVASEPYGRGLVVQGGGTADVSTTAFIDNEEIAIVLNASTTTLRQIVVRDTELTPSGDFGRAIDAFDLGNFMLDSSTFTSNHDASIMVVNSQATISKSIVQDTQFDGTMATGRGVTVQQGANVTMNGCAILGSRESGIAVFSDPTTFTLSKSFIEATALNGSGSLGYGIVGVDGPILTIQNSELDGCAGAGIAFGGAGGVVSSSVISNNAVGIATSDDETLSQVDSPPSSVDAGTVDVTSDTVFIANQTRVASGAIPLPSALGPPK